LRDKILRFREAGTICPKCKHRVNESEEKELLEKKRVRPVEEEEEAPEEKPAAAAEEEETEEKVEESLRKRRSSWRTSAADRGIRSRVRGIARSPWRAWGQSGRPRRPHP